MRLLAFDADPAEYRERNPGEAPLAIAQAHGFLDWSALEEYAAAVAPHDSPVRAFESAVEAGISGDLPRLKLLLAAHPDLARARSSRITPLDPARHRATLLHYMAANGVENHRQTSPANAAEVARTLLEAGAAPDALADMYGGTATTLCMLVSSTPPAEAGVQLALLHTL